jgi:ferric-dicitrate binding protein FerR (iron transport regulator)
MRRDEQVAFTQWLAASRLHCTAYKNIELLWVRLEVARAVPRVLRWREEARREGSLWHRWRAAKKIP